MIKTATENRRILIIDDNESIHQDFRKILNPATPGKTALASAAAELFGEKLENERTGLGFEVDSAFQGQQGLEKVREACAAQRPYAMAFVDLRMPPGWDGIETISRIWSEYPELQVVICTAYSDYSLDQIAGRLVRTDRMLILKKPFDSIEVLQFADALTVKWRLARDVRAKMEDLEGRVAERTQELREGQQQLTEARKMELVGKLAGGIAHHFNTLLTSILGHAELIRQANGMESQGFRSAVEIGKSAGTAAALTHQLLAFSRRQMLKPELLDINAAIHGIEPQLRTLLDGEIEVTIAGNASCPWTLADGTQLREVLLSLAENSRDAMPRGGQFIVETGNATMEAAGGGDTAGAAPGDYVTIAVTDTGCGLSDEVKAHLFEPFFTTKAPDQGRGLGLATCYGILKQSGGHIAARSDVGRGTTFTIYLPRYWEQTAVAVPPLAAGEPRRDGGIILLVEQDDTLRGMAATVLEQQGYTVHLSANSREAIAIAGRLPAMDLLLANATMPEMTGPELAEWLVSLHPGMKQLYVLAADEEETGPSCADTLRKPYAPAILTCKVREALGG